MHAPADRLTQLGPMPVIASLSLGATRTFRVTPKAPKAPPKGGPGAGPARARHGAQHGVQHGAQHGRSARSVARVDVPLPHNSLLVMWPPTQETTLHEAGAPARASGCLGWPSRGSS